MPTTGGVRTVPHDELRDLVVRVFLAAGAPPDTARDVARVTVEADLEGRATHGVVRVPAYVAAARRGDIDAVARVETLHDNGVVFGLDARHGFGQTALTIATRMAVTRAGVHGLAWGAVRDMANPGMLASYVRTAAQAGQVAVVGCNAAPAMAPYGGREARLGTNPIAVAFPGPDGPVLDMATSAVAKGTIRQAARDGLPIPPGWALDATGAPTSDPAAALAGLLAPAGGAKGAGLALVVDLLAGVLSGGAAGRGVTGLHDSGSVRVGAFVLTLRPDAFLPRAVFDAALAGYLADLRSSAPAAGFHEVLVPGERGARTRLERLESGVPVPDAVWQRLTMLAD